MSFRFLFFGILGRALEGDHEVEADFECSRLNVNFPKVDNRCRSPGDFKFVLSRIYPKVPFVGEDDVETCGSRRLPIERKVVGTPGCYASISVGEENKTTAPRRAQAFVLNRLKPILSCLP